MSSEYYSLSFPTASSLPLDLFLAALASAALLTLWLSPGGLAWALSKAFCKARPDPAIPGPTGFPIFGLVFAFTSSLTHRALSTLSKTCNAVKLMAFSVGFTRFVISSDPDTAKEILNSPAFANRPVKESAYELLFDRAMGFAPYGEYWRNLRRISATHLFSPKRMSGFGQFRREIGLNMVDEIKGLMGRNGVVEVKRVLHFGSLNNVMMSVFGKCYDFGGENNNKDGLELDGLVSEGYELLGMFNWSPVLCWLDLQGVRRRCRVLVGRVNVFVRKIIEEHRGKRAENGGAGDESSGDFVDVLLDLESDNKLSDSDMIAVLWFYTIVYECMMESVDLCYSKCFGAQKIVEENLNILSYSISLLEGKSICFVLFVLLFLMLFAYNADAPSFEELPDRWTRSYPQFMVSTLQITHPMTRGNDL
ncbi:hypothetical protein RHMOL_Rhmol08G0192200 [Rhododendron molle]|uniref:Uncharacterized protein n=1 Tax=Rhododendron molle TaxID=49168 RepID=A0ACC0MPY4_RHOML|nr:hypothetical protein RHMOL_Rhmol08G0192200 [Rhododendron molle]